jgi:flavin-dependent dehydrogenase
MGLGHKNTPVLNLFSFIYEWLYDVSVVGAGPSGSSTVHHLATMGLDILLLEKAFFPRDKSCGDGLTPRAPHGLTDIGVIDEITNKGYRVKG